MVEGNLFSVGKHASESWEQCIASEGTSEHESWMEHLTPANKDGFYAK